MTNETLMALANIFCGNTEELFKYKTGSKLVQFFNQYFGYNDIYRNPFPSRHIYVHNKLVELFNKNKLESFLNIILSKKYIMKEYQIIENEAVDKILEISKRFNSLFNMDGFTLQNKSNYFYLIKDEADLQPIGSGGFANVFKQRSTGLIIKRLKDDYWTDKGIVHRFKREFEITKSLEEFPFIINVYDYNESNYSYSMEEAELTLESYVLNNDLNDENKISIIRQVLHAMKIVHSKDIIHRDISPNNIFIFSGMLKIADFGLGKDLNVLNSHQTIHTNSVGQYLYCAPEQFMLLRDGDKRSDVFSLGRLINFIMTKDASNDNHIFRTVISKATNSNSVYRYEDAGELLDKVNQTIKYNNDTARFENCLNELSKGIFNDNIEQFIYELSGEKIVGFLILKNEKMNSSLLKFMKCSDEHSEFLIHSIEDSYRDKCSVFAFFDGISTFTSNIILDDFNYVTKESACRILKYIAKTVGRYHAQRLIENILSIGIEPLLEEILKD